MKVNLQTASVLVLAACLLITQPSYALTIDSQPANAEAANAAPAAQVTASAESTQVTAPAIAKELPVSVEDAMKEFKSLPRQERKARINEAKKELKEYKKNKHTNKNDGGTSTLLEVIIAIFIPPLAVYLHEGEINSKFWIDLLLTLLFYIPGLIYALVVILSKS